MPICSASSIWFIEKVVIGMSLLQHAQVLAAQEGTFLLGDGRLRQGELTVISMLFRAR